MVMAWTRTAPRQSGYYWVVLRDCPDKVDMVYHEWLPAHQSGHCYCATSVCPLFPQEIALWQGPLAAPDLPEQPVRTEQTYTDAPPEYDGFGTRTLKLAGRLTNSPMGPRDVRLVETPVEHLEWQRTRYASGGYVSASHDEFRRLESLLIAAPPQGLKP